MFNSTANKESKDSPMGLKLHGLNIPDISCQQPHREFFHISSISDCIENKPKEERVKKFSRDKQIQTTSVNFSNWSVILD